MHGKSKHWRAGGIPEYCLVTDISLVLSFNLKKLKLFKLTKRAFIPTFDEFRFDLMTITLVMLKPVLP